MYWDFTDFINTTAAELVNDDLNGYGSREELKNRIGDFGLSPAGQEMLLDKAMALKEVYHCSG